MTGQDLNSVMQAAAMVANTVQTTARRLVHARLDVVGDQYSNHPTIGVMVVRAKTALTLEESSRTEAVLRAFGGFFRTTAKAKGLPECAALEILKLISTAAEYSVGDPVETEYSRDAVRDGYGGPTEFRTDYTRHNERSEELRRMCVRIQKMCDTPTVQELANQVQHLIHCGVRQ